MGIQSCFFRCCACGVVRPYVTKSAVKVKYISNKIWKNSKKIYRKVLWIISFKCNTKILKTSKDIPKKHFKIWKSGKSENLRANPRYEIQNRNRNLKKLKKYQTFFKVSEISFRLIWGLFEGHFGVIWWSFGV